MTLSDVFISYSRRNADFAGSLDKALSATGKDVWIDWEDIPYSAKWWDEISQAITGAGTFICVLSPEYFASQTCMEELKVAEGLNKRIIPVLCREFDPQQAPDKHVSQINWISFCGPHSFDVSFKSLLDTINQDLDWVKFHTRLLVRATEWAEKKNDSSYHLYGKDLDEAIAQELNNTGKSPPLNTLQQNYIKSSQGGAEHLQRKQLRGFYLMSLIYALAQMAVLYLVLFNQISETELVSLSWVWLPGLAFALSGFTIGQRSLMRSLVGMAVVMVLFYLFYQVLWQHL
jgi:hypothetical protein